MSVERIFYTKASDETQALAARMASNAPSGLVVALSGNLGAGKTTFVQGMAVGLGVDDRVTSPTFTLVNEYTSSDGRRLVHVDIYRLMGGAESPLQAAATFGLEEILDEGDAIVAIEWAEGVAHLLPADHLIVQIGQENNADNRTLRFTATGPKQHGSGRQAGLRIPSPSRVSVPKSTVRPVFSGA